MMAQRGTHGLGRSRELCTPRGGQGRRDPAARVVSEGLPGPGELGGETEADSSSCKGRPRPGPLALERQDAHLATVSPERGPVLSRQGAGLDRQRGSGSVLACPA